MENLNENSESTVCLIFCSSAQLSRLKRCLDTLAYPANFKVSIGLHKTTKEVLHPGMVAGTWATMGKAFEYLGFLWDGWEYWNEGPEFLADLEALLQRGTNAISNADQSGIAVFAVMNASALLRITRYCKELGLTMVRHPARTLRSEKGVEKERKLSETGKKRRQLREQLCSLEDCVVEALRRGDEYEASNIRNRIKAIEEHEARLPSVIVIGS